MNTAFKTSLVALSVAAAGVPVLAIGNAEVLYVEPEKFTDVGFGSIERERALQSLTQHFEALGKRLPDGQVLRVEVLDVNLAGEVWARGMHQVRVLRGAADWPQMTLRYTVLEGSRTLKAGEVRLTDMSYQFNQQRIHQYGDLPYEKRMLDKWFKDALAPATP